MVLIVVLNFSQSVMAQREGRSGCGWKGVEEGKMTWVRRRGREVELWGVAQREGCGWAGVRGATAERERDYEVGWGI